MTRTIFRKNKCWACYKMFVPEFCKICELRDYGLCHGCHKRSVHHCIEARRSVR